MGEASQGDPLTEDMRQLKKGQILEEFFHKSSMRPSGTIRRLSLLETSDNEIPSELTLRMCQTNCVILVPQEDFFVREVDNSATF